MDCKELLNLLYQMYPNAGCELEYFSPFSFLCAVILSAQTTDKAVNKVTKELFSRYKTIDSLANANRNEIMQIIAPIGLMKNKSEYIIKLANIVKNKYNGTIPTKREELLQLPGVGRKTANVYLAQIYNVPAIAVDTHVNRVSKRLGLALEEDSVLDVENKLMEYFAKDDWIRAHHGLLFLGRYKCLAKKPECQTCLLKKNCKYWKEINENE